MSDSIILQSGSGNPIDQAVRCIVRYGPHDGNVFHRIHGEMRFQHPVRAYIVDVTGHTNFVQDTVQDIRNKLAEAERG